MKQSNYPASNTARGNKVTATPLSLRKSKQNVVIKPCQQLQAVGITKKQNLNVATTAKAIPALAKIQNPFADLPESYNCNHHFRSTSKPYDFDSSPFARDGTDLEDLFEDSDREDAKNDQKEHIVEEPPQFQKVIELSPLAKNYLFTNDDMQTPEAVP